PPPRKTRVFAAPVLDPVKPLIDAMLRQDLDAPKKQRHTARRILARLVDEHQVTAISYPTVRDYAARRRPEILAAAGRPLAAAFVPQAHEPGAEGEVDFHDLWVILRGVKTKTALFTMRLSYSGRAAHRASLSQGQEAFLEAHVYAFGRFGGVPAEKIRYDNLTSAVKRVVFGRTRVENQRWVAFRSHYGFDAWYCIPGHEGSHEKGGVEGEGGRFRRNHCVPMPVVDSIEELNALLEAADDADDRRRIGNRTMTVGHDWALARGLLRPPPACSPASMRRSGPRPARPTAMQPAPGGWSRCCCCTATCRPPTCWPGSRPPCRSGRPMRTWSRWRPAKSPSSAAAALRCSPRHHGSRWSASPRGGWRPRPAMTGRCPRSPPTTSCWAGSRRDRRPARGHRAGRVRGDRAGLPDAAAAHDAGPVHRDRRRCRAGAAVLLGVSRRAGNGRVRRPGPAPRRPPGARGRLPAPETAR